LPIQSASEAATCSALAMSTEAMSTHKR
jgi:hypothetical protein